MKGQKVTFTLGPYNIITLDQKEPNVRNARAKPKKQHKQQPTVQQPPSTETEQDSAPLPTPHGISEVIDLTLSQSQSQPPDGSAPPPNPPPPPPNTPARQPPPLPLMPEAYDWTLPPPVVTPNRFDIMSTPPESQIPNFSPANSQEMDIMKHFHESPETPHLSYTPAILRYDRDARHPQHMPEPVQPNATDRIPTPPPAESSSN